MKAIKTPEEVGEKYLEGYRQGESSGRIGYVEWDREKVAKEICSLKGSSWCERGCIDCGWLQGAYEVADRLYKELNKEVSNE